MLRATGLHSDIDAPKAYPDYVRRRPPLKHSMVLYGIMSQL